MNEETIIRLFDPDREELKYETVFKTWSIMKSRLEFAFIRGKREKAELPWQGLCITRELDCAKKEEIRQLIIERSKAVVLYAMLPDNTARLFFEAMHPVEQSGVGILLRALHKHILDLRTSRSKFNWFCRYISGVRNAALAADYFVRDLDQLSESALRIVDIHQAGVHIARWRGDIEPGIQQPRLTLTPDISPDATRE